MLLMEYDFDDSLSVYQGNKFIGKYHLKYKLPKDTTSIYPDNRLMIFLDHNKLFKTNKVYTIVFWGQKVFVKLKIYKTIPYYSLGFKKDSPHWSLLLDSEFPWPG